MATANITTVFNGTVPFDVNVTACNLLTDLSIKDFAVNNISDNVFESNTLWTKVTATLIRYSGGSGTLTTGDTITIRRKTPNSVVQVVNYATRFSSSLWNQELDRQVRWREEADLNGVGAAGLSQLPINDPYTVAWGSDVISPPTRATLFNYFGSELQAGYKNKLINGRFDVWQRGNSGAITAATSGSFQDQRIYLADKWTFIQNTATGTSKSITVTREAHPAGQTTVPGNPKFYLRINTTSTGNPTGSFSTRLIQSVEDVTQLAGKTVTLSAYLRSNINSKFVGYRIMRNMGTGGSGVSDVAAGSWFVHNSNAFQRFSATWTMPTLTGTTMGAEGSDVYYIMFYIHSAESEVPSAINVGVGTVDISDVQLELGSSPTAIEPVPFSLEVLKCMRYYQQASPYGNLPQTTTFGGRNLQYHTSGSGQWGDTINFPVLMARTPSVSVYGTGGTAGMIHRAGVDTPANVANINTYGFFLFNNAGTAFTTLFYTWSATVEYL